MQALYGGFVRRELRWLLLYGVLWALGTGIVYAVQGVGVTYWTPERVLWYNLRDLGQETFAFLPLLLLLLWFSLRHWRQAAGFMRACVPPLLLYLICFAVFGAWTESRILTPVIPLLIALLLHHPLAPPTARACRWRG